MSDTVSAQKNTTKVKKIENSIVFIVIPLVLTIIFLLPVIAKQNNNKKNAQYLQGSWYRPEGKNEHLQIFADNTYILNKKKGKVLLTEKDISLTAHGTFQIKILENKLIFTNNQNKQFVWIRDNFSYPGVWVEKGNRILVFSMDDYSYYNIANGKKEFISGSYTASKQIVTLKGIEVKGKWHGKTLSFGPKYTKVLDFPVTTISKEIISGVWKHGDLLLTFFKDGTYTFKNDIHKKYTIKTNCVLLDDIPGVFVLTATGGNFVGIEGNVLSYTK